MMYSQAHTIVEKKLEHGSAKLMLEHIVQNALVGYIGINELDNDIRNHQVGDAGLSISP